MTDKARQRLQDFELAAHWLFRALIGVGVFFILEMKQDIKDIKKSLIERSVKESRMETRLEDHGRRIEVVEGDIKRYHAGK